MTKVRRSVKQKVVAAAAVAALLAGGSIAAVSATGQSNPRKHAHAHRSSRPRAVTSRGGRLSRRRTGAADRRAAPEASRSRRSPTRPAASPPRGLIEAMVAARKARLAEDRREAAHTHRRRGQPRRRAERRPAPRAQQRGAHRRVVRRALRPALAGGELSRPQRVAVEGRAELGKDARAGRRCHAGQVAGGPDRSAAAGAQQQGSHRRPRRAGSRRRARPSARGPAAEAHRRVGAAPIRGRALAAAKAPPRAVPTIFAEGHRSSG